MFRLACIRRHPRAVASRFLSTESSPPAPFSFQSVSSTRSLPADRATFDAHGVVAFRQPEPTVSASAARWRETALVCLETYSALAHSAPGGFGLKKEGGFREIVQKDVGRFDLNMDHVDDAVADAGEVGFISAVRRHAEDAIRPLLVDLFGADYVLNGKGVVISCPGATAQNWHVDSSHLFTQAQLGPLISSSSSTPTPTPLRLPCHFVTVFVPLYHARPEVGPTQFLLGSAPYTYTLPNSVVADQYPPQSGIDRIAPHAKDVVMQCQPGDVVLMDGRTLHRGLANQSTETRPLCYFSFCAPWYKEWPRSQNEGRSLFDEYREHRQKARERRPAGRQSAESFFTS